jgi:hypothetical protein
MASVGCTAAQSDSEPMPRRVSTTTAPTVPPTEPAPLPALSTPPTTAAPDVCANPELIEHVYAGNVDECYADEARADYMEEQRQEFEQEFPP